MMRLKLGILGATGRMGRLILDLIPEFEMFEAVSETGRDAVLHADVIVDFTHKDVTSVHLDWIAESRKPFVLGTTGLDENHHKKIKEISQLAPLFVAPNMTLGHNLLERLTTQSAEVLGEKFDIEILEIHHNQKKDAPSGTALALGQCAAKGRDLQEPQFMCGDRSGKRTSNMIGISTIRGGGGAGEHKVMFLGPDESIHLVHKVSDRKVFARGALNAAAWVYNKKPGFYTMSDFFNDCII